MPHSHIGQFSVLFTAWMAVVVCILVAVVVIKKKGRP
jgi:hypothetical protein